ncbi:hypothetical protein [Gordonibacter sp. An230]|uniref:hypothetical protein n=1 Tax=Gordonibacter sp. An230 TaxID=1965592 RepID=UPI0013A65A74|nr:hypothetical protein [Gordonibacter sp. An230]
MRQFDKRTLNYMGVLMAMLDVSAVPHEPAGAIVAAPDIAHSHAMGDLGKAPSTSSRTRCAA